MNITSSYSKLEGQTVHGSEEIEKRKDGLLISCLQVDLQFKISMNVCSNCIDIIKIELFVNFYFWEITIQIIYQTNCAVNIKKNI